MPAMRLLPRHPACALLALAAAGPLYPDGLPIWPEGDLERVLREERVDKCLLSYSDLAYAQVMTLAGRCLAGPADR